MAKEIVELNGMERKKGCLKFPTLSLSWSSFAFDRCDDHTMQTEFWSAIENFDLTNSFEFFRHHYLKFNHHDRIRKESKSRGEPLPSNVHYFCFCFWCFEAATYKILFLPNFDKKRGGGQTLFWICFLCWIILISALLFLHFEAIFFSGALTPILENLKMDYESPLPIKGWGQTSVLTWRHYACYNYNKMATWMAILAEEIGISFCLFRPQFAS